MNRLDPLEVASSRTAAERSGRESARIEGTVGLKQGERRLVRLQRELFVVQDPVNVVAEVAAADDEEQVLVPGLREVLLQ